MKSFWTEDMQTVVRAIAIRNAKVGYSCYILVHGKLEIIHKKNQKR